MLAANCQAERSRSPLLLVYLELKQQYLGKKLKVANKKLGFDSAQPDKLFKLFFCNAIRMSP
ncbi:hypothetical protein ASE40_00310 [Flavobacterium sp. Root935]|nr:hypothetical protein ASE40_00310 [Flavobacterium sp. Root935]